MLIDKVKELQELEQHWTEECKSDWPSTKEIESHHTYINALSDAAPSLLKVLSCFEKGDADIVRCIRVNGKETVFTREYINVLARLQKACQLMEEE
jgi:hypothetical protein